MECIRKGRVQGGHLRQMKWDRAAKVAAQGAMTVKAAALFACSRRSWRWCAATRQAKALLARKPLARDCILMAAE